MLVFLGIFGVFIHMFKNMDNGNGNSLKTTSSQFVKVLIHKRSTSYT